MSNRGRACIASLILIASVGFTARGEELRPAMEQANAAFLEAFNRPNPAGFAALYTPDAVLLFSGLPPKTGPEGDYAVLGIPDRGGGQGPHLPDCRCLGRRQIRLSAGKGRRATGSARRRKDHDLRVHGTDLRTTKRRHLEDEGAHVQPPGRSLVAARSLCVSSP